MALHPAQWSIARAEPAIRCCGLSVVFLSLVMRFCESASCQSFASRQGRSCGGENALLSGAAEQPPLADRFLWRHAEVASPCVSGCGLPTVTVQDVNQSPNEHTTVDTLTLLPFNMATILFVVRVRKHNVMWPRCNT